MDEERVEQLLAAAAESPALDYKRELRPDEKRHCVALAKDIGAMAARGGDILIGADDSGAVTGSVTERDRELFDESRLRDKLKQWLPPRTMVRTAAHHIGEHLVILIAVEPHPLGICVMAADGNYEGGCEFRAGDVFIRRGTQSVRWSEAEVADFVDRARHQQREAVRVEIRQEWEAATRVTAPAQSVRQASPAATNWALDLDTLVEAVVEALRHGDEVALRRLLVGFPREVAQLARGTQGIERTADLLDRAGALLAQMAVIGRDDVFDEIIRRFASAYESALDNPHPGSAVPAPALGLMMLERLYAVGALLVRERRFDLLQTLATAGVRSSQTAAIPFLLANIQRSAERQGFMRTVDAERPPHTWMLSRASEAAAQNPWLVPDILPNDDRLMTSLCEFDLLCSLAAKKQGQAVSERCVFANFAGWFSQRTDPIVVELLDRSSAVRAAIFPEDDQVLAEALRLLQRHGLSRWGTLVPPWDGFEDERIVSFLEEHPPR